MIRNANNQKIKLLQKQQSGKSLDENYELDEISQKNYNDNEDSNNSSYNTLSLILITIYNNDDSDINNFDNTIVNICIKVLILSIIIILRRWNHHFYIFRFLHFDWSRVSIIGILLVILLGTTKYRSTN